MKYLNREDLKVGETYYFYDWKCSSGHENIVQKTIPSIKSFRLASPQHVYKDGMLEVVMDRRTDPTTKTISTGVVTNCSRSNLNNILLDVAEVEFFKKSKEGLEDKIFSRALVKRLQTGSYFLSNCDRCNYYIFESKRDAYADLIGRVKSNKKIIDDTLNFIENQLFSINGELSKISSPSSSSSYSEKKINAGTEIWYAYFKVDDLDSVRYQGRYLRVMGLSLQEIPPKKTKVTKDFDNNYELYTEDFPDGIWKGSVLFDKDKDALFCKFLKHKKRAFELVKYKYEMAKELIERKLEKLEERASNII